HPSGRRMLAQWFSRWRSPRPGAVTQPESPPPPAKVTRPPGTAVSSTNPQGSWLVARRPLIDRSGGIAGWDLQLSAPAIQRLARPNTPRVLREAYWFALAQAARETADAGRRVLLGLPGDAVAHATFLDQLPTRTILRVDENQACDLAALDAGWAIRIETRGL